MDQRSGIAPAKLVNAINASDQDKNDGQAQKAHKHLKPRRYLRPLALLGDALSARVADRVVGGEADEQRQREHLEGETGERDVDADIGLAF